MDNAKVTLLLRGHCRKYVEDCGVGLRTGIESSVGSLRHVFNWLRTCWWTTVKSLMVDPNSHTGWKHKKGDGIIVDVCGTSERLRDLRLDEREALCRTQTNNW